MITAVSSPEPPEEPQKPKTEDEIIAGYRVFRKDTLTEAATAFNRYVVRKKVLVDAATVFTLPKIAVRNILANAVVAGARA